MTEIEEKQGDFEMYFGPAHPGSGNFSVRVQLRGERVMKAVVDPGYLHRGFEKLMEYLYMVRCNVNGNRIYHWI